MAWKAAVLLVVGALLVGVSQSKAEIRIAVVGAMSGQFASIGTEFKQGVNGSVERLNAAGGLLGQKITVLERDDGCDPAKAKVIAEELASMKVALVVGHLCSGASIAASEIYARHGIVQITPASTAPQFTERGLTNVFRTCGRDDMQSFVVADHIARRYGTKKVGIVYDETLYSRELAKLTKQALNKAGVKERFFLAVPKDATDFSKVLAKVEQDEVGVLFFPSYAKPVSALLTQAWEKDIRFKLIGGDSLMNEDFLKFAGKLSEGVELSFPPDPSQDRRNRELTKEFRAAGENPDAFTFYNYAAVQVWAQAVAKVHSTDGDKVAEALRANTFDTVLGRVGFNAKGDISEPGFVMYVFINGVAEYQE